MCDMFYRTVVTQYALHDYQEAFQLVVGMNREEDRAEYAYDMAEVLGRAGRKKQALLVMYYLETISKPDVYGYRPFEAERVILTSRIRKGFEQKPDPRYSYPDRIDRFIRRPRASRLNRIVESPVIIFRDEKQALDFIGA